MKRQIIIAADDFGFSEAFNIGAVKACRKGVATVLNLLCNMPATENRVSAHSADSTYQLRAGKTRQCAGRHQVTGG